MNNDYKDLFDQLGLSDLSEEEKNKRFLEMQDVIEQRVFLRIMNLLSDEDKKVFENFESDEETDKFFVDKKIDTEQISLEEALAYREELIGNMSYMMGKLDK